MLSLFIMDEECLHSFAPTHWPLHAPMVSHLQVFCRAKRKGAHLEAHVFVVRTGSPDRGQSANAMGPNVPPHSAVRRVLNQIPKHDDVAIAMPCILPAIWNVEVAGVHAKIVVATARCLVMAVAKEAWCLHRRISAKVDPRPDYNFRRVDRGCLERFRRQANSLSERLTRKLKERFESSGQLACDSTCLFSTDAIMCTIHLEHSLGECNPTSDSVLACLGNAITAIGKSHANLILLRFRSMCLSLLSMAVSTTLPQPAAKETGRKIRGIRASWHDTCTGVAGTLGMVFHQVWAVITRCLVAAQ